MSKDPAFLFYSSDFLTGTMFLSDDQVGKFIRLLCVQHQKGRLRKKDMLKICKTYDEDVFEMFKTDEQDMYFNERLEAEAKKRKAYSESRRTNRKNKDESSVVNISKTYDEHMENENEDVNRNRNKNKINIPTEQEFLEYGITIYKQLGKDSEPFEFAILSKYNSWKDNGWKNGHGKPIKNWKNNLNNTIPHIKGIYNGKQSSKNGQSYSNEFKEELARKIQSS